MGKHEGDGRSTGRDHQAKHDGSQTKAQDQASKTGGFRAGNTDPNRRGLGRAEGNRSDR